MKKKSVVNKYPHPRQEPCLEKKQFSLWQMKEIMSSGTNSHHLQILHVTFKSLFIQRDQMLHSLWQRREFCFLDIWNIRQAHRTHRSFANKAHDRQQHTHDKTWQHFSWLYMEVKGTQEHTNPPQYPCFADTPTCKNSERSSILCWSLASSFPWFLKS